MKMNLLRSARSRRIATEHDFPLLPATEADPMAEEEVLQIQRYLHVPTIQRASLQPFEIEHSANVSLQDCITHHRQAFNFLRYFIDPPKDETYRRMLEKQLEAHDDRYEYLQRIQDRGYRTIPIKIPTRHSMLESVGSTDAAGRRTLTAIPSRPKDEDIHMHWLDVRDETDQHLLYSLQAAKHETLAMSHGLLRRGGEFIPGANNRNESIEAVLVALSHPPDMNIVTVSVTRLSETTRTTAPTATHTTDASTTSRPHTSAASPPSPREPPQAALASTPGSALCYAEPREGQPGIIEIPDRQAYKGRHRMWSPRRFWYGGRQFVWLPPSSGSKIACETLCEVASSKLDPQSKTGKRIYSLVVDAGGDAVPLVWGEGVTKWDVRGTIVLHAGLDEGFVEYVLAVQLTRMIVQAISASETNPVMQGPVTTTEF